MRLANSLDWYTVSCHRRRFCSYLRLKNSRMIFHRTSDFNEASLLSLSLSLSREVLHSIKSRFGIARRKLEFFLFDSHKCYIV